MRVLIDECLPKRRARALVGCAARTVPQAGWAGKTNGELLSLAESAFDVFVTIDQNLVHQQMLTGRRLAVIVIVASSNRFEVLEAVVPKLLEALGSVRPGELLRVSG